jgi:hypothetical protein
MKKNLIEDFYELLNTKKQQEHTMKKQFHNSRTREDMTQHEYHKPKLAPKTRSINTSRDNLSVRNYSNMLH